MSNETNSKPEKEKRKPMMYCERCMYVIFSGERCKCKPEYQRLKEWM